MSYLLAAKKEGDVLAWRGITSYSVTFRQELLNRLGGCVPEEALQLLQQTRRHLEAVEQTNREFENSCQRYLTEIAEVTELPVLRNLTESYYQILYTHVSQFYSATAFYEKSSQLLTVLASTILRISQERLGLLARNLPQLALIALGTAGRQEYSPFCPLQLMLLHPPVSGIGLEAVRQCGQLIHEGFEACGLRMDSSVTPRHGSWCGSSNDWIRRMEAGISQGDSSLLIDLLRLADQTPLSDDLKSANEFTRLCRESLSTSRIALENLVSRVTLLSNGLGILGRLRLEKSGPYRGRFPLLDHALQPLTGSLSAFALMSLLTTSATPDRIRELLGRHELNVDTAEKLLEAWQTINQLRLIHEQLSQSDWTDSAPLHLDIEKLTQHDQQALRDALEAIGLFQHHLYSSFSSLGK